MNPTPNRKGNKRTNYVTLELFPSLKPLQYDAHDIGSFENGSFVQAPAWKAPSAPAPSASGRSAPARPASALASSSPAQRAPPRVRPSAAQPAQAASPQSLARIIHPDQIIYKNPDHQHETIAHAIIIHSRVNFFLSSTPHNKATVVAGWHTGSGPSRNASFDPDFKLHVTVQFLLGVQPLCTQHVYPCGVQIGIPPTALQLGMLGQAAALVTMQLAAGEESGKTYPEITSPKLEEFAEQRDDVFGSEMGSQVKARKVLSVKRPAQEALPATPPASSVQQRFQLRHPLSDTEYPDQYAAEDSYAAEARNHVDASKAPLVEARKDAVAPNSPGVEAQKTRKTMLERWLASPPTGRPFPTLQESQQTVQLTSLAVGEGNPPVTGRKKRRKKKKQKREAVLDAEQEKQLALDEEWRQQEIQAEAPPAEGQERLAAEQKKLQEMEAETAAAGEQEHLALEEKRLHELQDDRAAPEQRKRIALERQKKLQEVKAEQAAAEERQRRLVRKLKQVEDPVEQKKLQEMQAERAASEEREPANQKERLQELQARQAAAEKRERVAAVQKRLQELEAQRAAVDELESRGLEQEKVQGLSTHQLAYLKVKRAADEERKRSALEQTQVEQAANAEQDRIAQEQRQRAIEAAAQDEERVAYERRKAQQEQLALEAKDRQEKAKEVFALQLQEAIALQKKTQQQKLEAERAPKEEQDRIEREELQQMRQMVAQSDGQVANERRKAQHMRDALEGGSRQKQIEEVVAFAMRELQARQAATTTEQDRIAAEAKKSWEKKQQFFVLKELARRNREQRKAQSEFDDEGTDIRYWKWKDADLVNKEQESAEQVALSVLGGLLARKHTDEEFAAAVRRAEEVLGSGGAEVSDAESEF